MEIKTIKEQAYDIILKKILTGEYPLGSRINITSISQELGISNSPIREALNQLEQQGLVVTTRNSGINIVSLSKVDRFELCQIILFWMTGAYDFCRSNGRSAELCGKMEEALLLQEASFKEHDAYQYTYYANRFDRCILEATGNQRLLAQFDNIFPLFFLGSVYDQEQSDTSWQIGLRQHKKILRAIKEDRYDDVISGLQEHYYKPVWDMRPRGGAKPCKTASRSPSAPKKDRG